MWRAGPKPSTTPASSRNRNGSEPRHRSGNADQDAVRLFGGGAVRRSQRRGEARGAPRRARLDRLRAGRQRAQDHHHAARGVAGDFRPSAGHRVRPKIAARPHRCAARQRPDGPRARLRRYAYGRRRAAHQFAGARRFVCARRTRAGERRRLHAGLCDRFRGRRALRPHRAGPSQRRLASDRHARHHRGRRGLRQTAQARPAAAHLHAGHRRDPSRRHAAKPRHHGKIVSRRQGRVERRAGGAARRARF